MIEKIKKGSNKIANKDAELVSAGKCKTNIRINVFVSRPLPLYIFSDTFLTSVVFSNSMNYRQWRDLKQTCCPDNPDVDTCDFTTGFNYVFMNDSKTDCGNKVPKFTVEI